MRERALYAEEYVRLKSAYTHEKASITLEGDAEIVNIRFESKASSFLPGAEEYRCDNHNRYFVAQMEMNREFFVPPLNEILHVLDSEIEENRVFSYPVFKKRSKTKANGVIVLVHGLNERSWDKYLPWAKRLLERSGRAVLLFPIAFHMNRAPLKWSDRRLMSMVSKERKKIFPTVTASTLANAAVSTRLQLCPPRFFWSGLQSYFDVIRIVKQVQDGLHPCIERDATVDFFGYSIGAFLTQLILMADLDRMLPDSRLFIFCGGPTVNRMSPVSRYILDSEANIALYSYFIENFEEELKRDARMREFFNDATPEGRYFRAMLDYHKMAGLRESRFHALSGRIMAVGLEKDDVIPKYEIENTLRGRNRDIPIRIETVDFPYRYTHENPFPAGRRHAKAVDESFTEVLDLAADFLR
ncbi:MAG: hypothetical protein JXQ30_09410 [Spirochaetes bacterium]|nr:hypothetical protein [Spirochaetota bacterium]